MITNRHTFNFYKVETLQDFISYLNAVARRSDSAAHDVKFLAPFSLQLIQAVRPDGSSYMTMHTGQPLGGVK